MDRTDRLVMLLLVGCFLVGAGVWLWAGLPALLIYAGVVLVVGAVAGLRSERSSAG